MFTKLTNEGRQTIKSNPQRIKEVDKEMEKMGVKVIGQYAVLGPYDFISVLEAPDNETVIKASIELGSRGTVHIVTCPAMPIFEFIEKMDIFAQLKDTEKTSIPEEFEEKMY